MRSLDGTLIEFGIDPMAIDLTLVEVWQRIPTADKPRKRNGAVLVKRDGAVIVRNWATEETAVWQPDKGSNVRCLSQHKAADERARQRRAELKRQAEAADECDRIWESAKPARPDHPYLVKKKLPPLELRECGEVNGWPGRWLLCPLYSERDPTRKINLECINQDGVKRPIKGALRRAVWGYAGPGYPYDTIFIAEGWSTAAALAVSLNICTVFSVGKGNLPRVAEIHRAAQPKATIIIAADNDPDGGGGEQARLAARHVGIVRALPDPRFGDWCDVFVGHGPEALREVFARWI